jgi:TRAP-type mannitol/chloroaromatic compound transport system substrate-binding protein
VKRRQLLGAAAAATVPLSAPGADAVESFQWKMVTSWPANSPGVGTGARRLAELIERLSNGRLRVRLFPAGELVPPLQVLDAVQQGTAEMAHTALYYAAGKAPALHFFTTVPFGMDLNELAAWLRFGGGQDLKDEVLAAFGAQAFYAGNSGTQAMGWFRTEIRSLDDIKGLKMRIAGLGGAAMTKLGATAVMMPPGEIFGAMRAGTVDAAEWVGPWNDLAFGLHKAASHYYLPSFHEPGAALDVVVSREAFGALPADLQEVVRSACAAAALDTSSEFLFHNVESFATLESQGVKVAAFPRDVVEALGRASGEVLTELMASDPEAQRVGESYLAFLARADDYARVMTGAMLAQRAVVRAESAG